MSYIAKLNNLGLYYTKQEKNDGEWIGEVWEPRGEHGVESMLVIKRSFSAKTLEQLEDEFEKFVNSLEL